MPNDLSVSVQGIKEAQANLAGIAQDIDPRGGLRSTMALAAGMVHRYVIGLGQDHPPIGQTGVLPVITGRLKNSLFWTVENEGNSLVGRVTSNLEYAGSAEARRGFMARTVQDMRQPVNDLIAADISSVITRKS